MYLGHVISLQVTQCSNWCASFHGTHSNVLLDIIIVYGLTAINWVCCVALCYCCFAQASKPRLPGLDSLRFFLIAYIGVGHFIAFATRDAFLLKLFSQVSACSFETYRTQGEGLTYALLKQLQWLLNRSESKHRSAASVWHQVFHRYEWFTDHNAVMAELRRDLEVAT